PVNISETTHAVLLIEVDGNNEDMIMQDCETISRIMMEDHSAEVLLADTSEQKEQWWRIRRCIGEAVKRDSIYKEEDTVVPRASLPQLLRTVKSIGEKYGFRSVCYGHAGDGNLHVNILRGNLSEEAWNNTVLDGIREL